MSHAQPSGNTRRLKRTGTGVVLRRAGSGAYIPAQDAAAREAEAARLAENLQSPAPRTNMVEAARKRLADPAYDLDAALELAVEVMLRRGR